MKLTEIVIARDFSEYPFGRNALDGHYSAEAFSKSLLIPALNEFDVVTVVLDGVFGFGSSFLEEVFGGLVRNGFTAVQLKSKLNIVYDEDKNMLKEVWGYIG